MTNNDVQCGNYTLNIYQVRAHHKNYSAILQHTKNTIGHGLCKCRLRVQIRSLGDRFHFAVWPEEGPLHFAECFFSRDSMHSHEQAWESKNAVQVDDDGHVSIKPAFALARRIDEPRKPAQLGLAKGSAPTKRRASLSALLDYLWMKSGNNHWFGHARSYGKAMYHVWDVAKLCKIGRAELTSILHIAGNTHFPVEKFKTSITPSVARVPSGLILGQVVGIPSTPQGTPVGYMLQVKNLGARVYMTVEQFSALQKSYPRVFSVFPHEQQVIALAQVELTGSKDFKLVDCAMMMTSRDFVPVDSSYEAQLCNLMVDAKRRFYKPLSVVHDLLPDFVLLDTPCETAMEVWGMLTNEYRAHMDTKIERYKVLGQTLWQWDAALGLPIPALPNPG